MERVEISQAGIAIEVPAAEICGRMVIATGKWLRIVAIKDEDWQEGELVPDPTEFLANLRRNEYLRADIFTFCQKLSDPYPIFPFSHEWESIAAITVRSYADWWNNQVSTDLRCDVRKASRRGVVVRAIPFTDELVSAVKEIYDETPVRQGRPFWHYRKSFEAVKAENATYLERATILGAFLGEELIGFLKIVYVDRLARMMQIISKDAHRDKRPMNALIAKAVEICEENGCTHLTYGNYRYSQGADTVTAFKRRNGFEEILVPRYHIPLTTKGALALRLELHHGIKHMMPEVVLRSLKGARATMYRRLLAKQSS